MALLLWLKERENEARESWKSAFYAGLLGMVARPEGWLTEDELCARLEANGVRDVSEHQLERWRGEGLLPRVQQEPRRYRGSVVYYRPGYCEQIVAVRELLHEKRKLDYVGWELWWRGFWVDERHWRPQLQRTAKTLDWTRKHLHKIVTADENSETAETIFDHAARLKPQNILISRIRGRLEINDLATALRVFLTTASGRFEDFEPVTKINANLSVHADDEKAARSHDHSQTIVALDFSQSETDTVLGKKFNFVGSIGGILRDVATVFRDHSFIDVQQSSDVDIASAREDARNALRMGLDLWEAMHWIYGPKAFGLRLIAWLARKYDRATGATLIVILIGPRKVSTDLLSSRDIAVLADQAGRIRDQSQQLRSLAMNDKRFVSVFSPKRFRKALKDTIALRQFLREIEAARDGRTPSE
jgi:hypothetical protein